MNKKYLGLLIGISLAIIGIIIIGQISQNQIGMNKESDNNTDKIENKTELKIAKIDIPENNTKSEQEIIDKLNEMEQNSKNNTYTPQPREWITSGPFQIDRSKYVLGEKIFIRMGGITPDEKGQIVFLRPLNQTHYSIYISIPFDGLTKNAFNLYIEPKLSAINHICSKNDLIGKWAVVFRGTEYPNLNFNMTDQILPGDEEKYNTPVC